MLFDDLLKECELTEKDVENLDRKNGEARMEIVVAALLRDGLTRRILLLAPFEIFAKQEIEKHKGELLHKSGLDEDSFDYLLDLIFAKINVVDREVLEPFRKRASEILKGF